MFILKISQAKRFRKFSDIWNIMEISLKIQLTKYSWLSMKVYGIESVIKTLKNWSSRDAFGLKSNNKFTPGKQHQFIIRKANLTCASLTSYIITSTVRYFCPFKLRFILIKYIDKFNGLKRSFYLCLKNDQSLCSFHIIHYIRRGPQKVNFNF